VRNPLDIFPSLANLLNTFSHSATVPFEYQKEFPEWWDRYIKMISKMHADYFKVLIQDCVIDKKNPIYFCRYEDLLDNPQKELTSIFKFLLEKDDLEGTNVS
jgi:hypothetical protein